MWIETMGLNGHVEICLNMWPPDIFYYAVAASVE